MSNKQLSRLRFNVGFLLEAALGTQREIELNYPEIRLSGDLTLRPLTGTFEAVRTSEGIYISGQLESTLQVECARCLGPVSIVAPLPLDDMFYYPPYLAPEGEYVTGEDGFIDLSPLVRELSLIAVPIQALCKPDCQGFCMECGFNLNEGDCGCEPEDVDPRLASLSDLL